MKILVAWDDQPEADLLGLYLTGDGTNEVDFAHSSENFLHLAEDPSYSVLLMTLSFPETVDEGFQNYEKALQLNPYTPIVMACRPEELINLPRFLMRGLRFYLFRDANKDYVFLINSTLEAALAAARAEEAKRLAEHLRKEIEGVRMLQEAIIPDGLQVPAGFAAVARYEPSQVTVMGDRPVVMAGGDYYDLFCPNNSTLTALIGDASGHGLKACMSIMTMHTLVRMLASDEYRDTASFVKAINNRLCESSIVQSGGGFITLLYSMLDTTNGVVTWTSAGHPVPILHNLETNEVVEVGTKHDGGLPLGIMANVDYQSYQVQMPSRSRLLIYSDGLPDALPDGRTDVPAFGVNGVMDSLKQTKDLDLNQTLSAVFDASQSFTGGDGRHDDTSVLLLERKE